MITDIAMHIDEFTGEAIQPLSVQDGRAQLRDIVGGDIQCLAFPIEKWEVGMDRMERFLSIWEEEGCRMVPMSCGEHDAYAANSQFVTHLVGRVLGNQGFVQTPIDTSGFESVLKLMDSTTADSFDLFMDSTSTMKFRPRRFAICKRPCKVW